MENQYAKYRAERYFSSLDGLRCISILAVIYHHTGTSDHPYFSISNYGYLGVQLFFAISGFLITTLLLREKEAYGEISLFNFYIRRTLRIFPVYYTVLLIYIIAVSLIEQNVLYKQTFFQNLPYYLTYTSNWFVDLKYPRTIFFFAWSLATEEQFYLCWPWIEKYFSEKRAVWIMIGLVLFVQLTAFIFLMGWAAPSNLPVRMILSISPAICFGVLLAHLLNNPKGFAVASKIIGYQWSSLFLFVCLLGGLFFQIGMFWVYVIMALIVGSCVIQEDHWLKGILTCWLFKKIGMISYCIYLIHMACFHAVLLIFGHFINFRMPHWVLFVATTLLASVIANLSYHYYEGYFLKLKDKYSRKRVKK